ncbi:MAG: aryl-sulfate sulfotransferase [Planctomycetota bacterium]
MRTMQFVSVPLAAGLLLLTFAACSSEAGEAAVLVAQPARTNVSPTSAFSGFTLVAPLDSRRVLLVDMAGEPVHHWDTASKPGVGVYLTERGTLLKCQRALDHPTFQDAGGQGGSIQELAADGEVLWNFEWNKESGLQHHDIEELPNGNILFIAWDRTSRRVAIEAGRDPELLEGEEWWSCAVYEVRPTRPAGGEIVWSWHAMDHLIQDHDPKLPRYGKPSEHPERIDINGDRDPEPPTEAEEAKIAAQMAAIGYAGGDDDQEEDEDDPETKERKARVKDADWMHTNAIAYNAALDQIVLSVRRYDEIWIIDHGLTTEEAKGPAGDLLYRWGNPYAYGMGKWEERQLHGQHNVQWIPEGRMGAGNLICFDNGARPQEWSRAVEWWAPRDASGRYPRPAGQPWGPAEPEWIYEAPTPENFYSPFISGVQRQPNGTTLICSGASGHVFEVTPAGEVVWDWKSPFTITADEVPGDDLKKFPNALFRAERYAADHPGIVALRAAGAAIPASAGSGPATNQYVEPEVETPDDEAAGD